MDYEYDIASASSTDAGIAFADLKERVYKLRQIGYKPQGGMSMVVTGTRLLVSQAMIKDYSLTVNGQ